MTNSNPPGLPTRTIPGTGLLWLAVLIFGASSALTRKLTEIGAEHWIDNSFTSSAGNRNPISFCNVLFVGNLCALLVLLGIHRRQLNWDTFRSLTGKQWSGLISVALLSGALAPGLFFQALSLTNVNNVVLVGRLEPPLTLALSVWLLGEQVNSWQVVGAIVAFVGVTLTIVLQPATVNMINMAGFNLGSGELLATIAAIALATATIVSRKRLSGVSLGIYSIFRTALGTLIFFGIALVLYGSDHFMDVLSPFLWQWMLLYGAVIVVVGQSAWVAGLRASTISEASLVASCTPIVGILAAYFILGEVPTQAQYIGGSVILVGIILSQIGVQTKAYRARVAISNSLMPTIQALESRIGFKGL